MAQIAAIGDHDSVYGFSALGLDVYPVESPETAAKQIRRLAAQHAAVIFLTESLAARLPELMAAYQDTVTPALIPIPGVSGNNGIGMQRVKDAMHKAAGSEIFSETTPQRGK